jgi:two-component system LytT family response regulator
MLSVLIADDELIARKTLEILVKEQDSNASIEFACDGFDAIKKMEERIFDIAFLDIQMPGKTGLEAAQVVPSTSSIVFVTAYDEYAIEAFALNAIDYVLKPVEDERFKQAFEKAKKRIYVDENAQIQERQRVLETVSNLLNKNKKLVLKEVGKIKIIDQEDIKYISGAGNYIEIHLIDGKTLVQRETLASIEKKLDLSLFSRIHKSTIVRNEMIIELRPTQKGDYIVKLKSGEEVVLSRRNKDKLQEIIS